MHPTAREPIRALGPLKPWTVTTLCFGVASHVPRTGWEYPMLVKTRAWKDASCIAFWLLSTATLCWWSGLAESNRKRQGGTVVTHLTGISLNWDFKLFSNLTLTHLSGISLNWDLQNFYCWICCFHLRLQAEITGKTLQMQLLNEAKPDYNAFFSHGRFAAVETRKHSNFSDSKTCLKSFGWLT